jgi:chaperonin cofactor prefoldin
MVLSGVYYSIQPQNFRLSAQWIYNQNPSQLQDVQINTTPPAIVRNSFRSSRLVEEVLEQNPEFEFEGDTEAISSSISQSVEFEQSEYDTNLVNIRYTTSKPNRDAQVLNAWLDNFVQMQQKQLRERLEEREKTLRTRLDYLQEQFQDWQKEWGDLQSDSLPRVIKTRLENAWKNYERAEKSSSKLREQLEVKRERLNKIEDLLEKEPKAFEIKMPLVKLSELIVSGRLAEQMNDAYTELRQNRVSFATQIASHKEALRQYENNQPEALDEIDQLQESLLRAEHQYNRLEQSGEILRKRITQYENELSAVQFVKSDLPDRFDLFYTEPPGEQIDQNGRRNTFLAGVVSFLLIFFGVAFWEIL